MHLARGLWLGRLWEPVFAVTARQGLIRELWLQKSAELDRRLGAEISSPTSRCMRGNQDNSADTPICDVALVQSEAPAFPLHAPVARLRVFPQIAQRQPLL